MVVKPDLSKVYPDMKRRRVSATDAVTKFKVLDSAKKGALVELEAITGRDQCCQCCGLLPYWATLVLLPR